MIPSNYGTQFMVAVKGHNIDVYKKDAKKIDFDEDYEDHAGIYTVLVKSYVNKKVFLGYDVEEKGWFDFFSKKVEIEYNTVLIETGACKYVHVGNTTMFEFKTDSPVLEYVSPMGNNTVTYAYAVTKERVYMMAFETSLPVSVMREKNWSYREGKPFKVKRISECPDGYAC